MQWGMLVVAVVLASGCARGGGGTVGEGAPDARPAIGTDAGPDDPRDASIARDAGSIARDAGSIARDAGTAPDAHRPPPDAPPSGGACTDPIDISAGGTFVADTCGKPDLLRAMCGAAGAPEIVLRGEAPFSGSTYSITVTEGFVLQQLDGGCGPMPFSCWPGSSGVSGATPGGRWLWLVERADGGCGPLEVVVERIM